MSKIDGFFVTNLTNWSNYFHREHRLEKMCTSSHIFSIYLENNLKFTSSPTQTAIDLITDNDLDVIKQQKKVLGLGFVWRLHRRKHTICSPSIPRYFFADSANFATELKVLRDNNTNGQKYCPLVLLSLQSPTMEYEICVCYEANFFVLLHFIGFIV